MIRADETTDISRDMDARASREIEAEIASREVDRIMRGGDEGRAAELAHRQAEQQMLHGGIAADRDISNVMRGEAEGAREIVTQRIDRRASGGL